MRKANKYTSEIMKIFYEVYSNPILCDISVSKPMKKKIEKFRNEIAVDFYNLTKDEGQISEFAKKYFPENIQAYLKKLGRTIEQYIFVDLSQPGYKILFDKALKGEHFDDGELSCVEHNIYGFIYQEWDNEEERWYFEAYGPDQISQIARALSEFVFLLINQ